MDIPNEILVAILLGIVLLVALVRGLYLTGRSLWWGEEAIGESPEPETENRRDSVEQSPSEPETPAEPENPEGT